MADNVSFSDSLFLLSTNNFGFLVLMGFIEYVLQLGQV